MVRAGDHPAGDAVAEQLDHRAAQAHPRFGSRKLTSVQGDGEPNPTWIPVANQAAEQLADNVGGMAGGTWGDLMNIPMTAHFIGGCAIGDSPQTGVIDPYHRLYGYPGLHVVDGSALSANLGVNPSLSITAQAERADVAVAQPGRRPTPGRRSARPISDSTPCTRRVPPYPTPLRPRCARWRWACRAAVWRSVRRCAAAV